MRVSNYDYVTFHSILHNVLKGNVCESRVEIIHMLKFKSETVE